MPPWLLNVYMGGIISENEVGDIGIKIFKGGKRMEIVQPDVWR